MACARRGLRPAPVRGWRLRFRCRVEYGLDELYLRIEPTYCPHPSNPLGWLDDRSLDARERGHPNGYELLPVGSMAIEFQRPGARLPERWRVADALHGYQWQPHRRLPAAHQSGR